MVQRRGMIWKKFGAWLLMAALVASMFAGCGKKDDGNGSGDVVQYDKVKADYVLIDEIVKLEKNALLRVTPSNDGEVAAELPAGEAIDWVAYGAVWSIVEYGGKVYFTSTGSLPVKSVSLEGKNKAGNGVTVAEPTEEAAESTEETETVKETELQTEAPTETEAPVETEPAPPETEAPTEPPAPVETPAPEPPAETAPPAPPVIPSGTTAVSRQPYAIPGFEDLGALPNDSLSHGYSNSDRDASNRPNGCLYLQKIYGDKYGADFIIKDPGSNVVFLTMDEGYEAGYTPTILDTLAQKGVKAVFFLTKQFVDEHPELVQRMINEGHILGNHTCAHPAAGIPSFGVDGTVNDVQTLHNIVQERFGYSMNLFRYPSGIFSEQSLALLHNMGYRCVFWSFAHRDWVTEDQPDPASSLQNMVNQVHPGAIYLLHAVSATNTQVLGQFIDEVRARGYEFGIYQ